jgi:hypothetical protein
MPLHHSSAKPSVIPPPRPILNASSNQPTAPTSTPKPKKKKKERKDEEIAVLKDLEDFKAKAIQKQVHPRHAPPDPSVADQHSPSVFEPRPAETLSREPAAAPTVPPGAIAQLAENTPTPVNVSEGTEPAFSTTNAAITQAPPVDTVQPILNPRTPNPLPPSSIATTILAPAIQLNAMVTSSVEEEPHLVSAVPRTATAMSSPPVREGLSEKITEDNEDALQQIPEQQSSESVEARSGKQEGAQDVSPDSTTSLNDLDAILPASMDEAGTQDDANMGTDLEQTLPGPTEVQGDGPAMEMDVDDTQPDTEPKNSSILSDHVTHADTMDTRDVAGPSTPELADLLIADQPPSPVMTLPHTSLEPPLPETISTGEDAVADGDMMSEENPATGPVGNQPPHFSRSEGRGDISPPEKCGSYELRTMRI